jgi:hypothetical protein
MASLDPTTVGPEWMAAAIRDLEAENEDVQEDRTPPDAFIRAEIFADRLCEHMPTIAKPCIMRNTEGVVFLWAYTDASSTRKYFMLCIPADGLAFLVGPRVTVEAFRGDALFDTMRELHLVTPW